MKRIIIVFLLTALLFLSLPLSSAAAAPNVSIQCVSAEAGGTVSAAVILSGNTGFADLSLEIGYDAAALQLVQVEPNSSIGCRFTSSQQLTQQPYLLNWVDGTSSNTFNGTLAVLHFQISTDAAGEYPITISHYKGINGNYIDGDDVNYDLNFDPLHLTYLSGKITVEAPKTKISVTLGGKTEVLSAKHALTGQICVAGYQENGRLCSVKFYPAAETIAALVDSSAVRAKIFWLDDSRPVCAAKTILLK